MWWISNATSGGFAQTVFGYGQAGDIPVCGDWDGNGTDTPGIVRGGMWYLSNTLTSPIADLSFAFGRAGDIPVVGDWDGNGTDTPGVVRNGTWYLANAANTGLADVSFGYGLATDIPVAGDWNNDGRDTPGVVRAGIWYVVNSLADPVRRRQLRLRQRHRSPPHRAMGARPASLDRHRPLAPPTPVRTVTSGPRRRLTAPPDSSARPRWCRWRCRRRRTHRRRAGPRC